MTARQCGSCTLCCKLVPVASLGKKAGVRCQHQRQAGGCAVYARRPLECKLWDCRWLADPDATELPRPDRSHIVIDVMEDVVELMHPEGFPVEFPMMQIWVDPAFPDSWDTPELRAFMERKAASDGVGTILRWNNLRGKAVFPPTLHGTGGQWREVDLPTLNPEIGRYSKLPDYLKPPL